MNYELLIFHLTFYIVPRFQEVDFAAGDFDADGQTLFHLDEIAGCVVARNKRKSRARCSRKRFYNAGVSFARHGVGGKFYRAAFLDVFELRLAVIGVNPFFAVVDDADDALTGLNKLTDVDFLFANHTVNSGGDNAVRQIELCNFHVSLSKADYSLVLRKSDSLFVLYQSRTLTRPRYLFVTCFGREICGVDIVVLLLRYRALFQEGFKTFFFPFGVVEMRLSLLDSGVRNRKIVLGGNNADIAALCPARALA